MFLMFGDCRRLRGAEISKSSGCSSSVTRSFAIILAVLALYVAVPASAEVPWPSGAPAAAKDPVTAEDFNNRGRLFIETGEYDAAFADFDKAIEIKPRFAAAFNNRGSIHFRKRAFDRAIADFNQAIAYEARDPVFYWNRAHAYDEMDANDQALGDYEQVILLTPEDFDATNRTKRGIAYLKKADYARAISEFDQSIWSSQQLEHRDGSALTYMNRGHAKFFLGDFSDAASDFSRAIEIAPVPDAMLWRYLARIRGGKIIAGPEIVASVAQLEPKQWPWPISELLLSRRTPEALLNAAQSVDERCQAQFYLGEWQVSHGDRISAADTFTAATVSCLKSRFEYVQAAAELKRLDGLREGVKASFDCSSTQTSIAKLICADPVLAQLDHEVSDKYKATLTSLDPATARALREDQRRFLITQDDSPRRPDYDVAQSLRDRAQMLGSVDPGRKEFFGEWLNQNGRGLVRNKRGTLVSFVSEPDCQFDGEGREVGKTLVAVRGETGHELEDWTLRLSRKGVALIVEEVAPRRGDGAKTSPYCNKGASVAGVYFPVNRR